MNNNNRAKTRFSYFIFTASGLKYIRKKNKTIYYFEFSLKISSQFKEIYCSKKIDALR